MAPLNWPFISQHLKLKAQGWQFTKRRAHFYSRLATHKRLFRRLRRRQQTIQEPHFFTSTKHHALTLLRNLTKHTAASFEAAKQLRSGRHTDLEVYAIRRMASNLEEPRRSRALTSSTKHYNTAISQHRSQTSLSQFLSFPTMTFPNTASNGSRQLSSNTSTWPFHCTFPITDFEKPPTRPYVLNYTTTELGKTLYTPHRLPPTYPVPALTCPLFFSILTHPPLMAIAFLPWINSHYHLISAFSSMRT